MKTFLVTGSLFLLLAACTTTGEIIIDERGVDMSRYKDNLAECKTYARQVAVARKTTKGAVTGAGVGGAVGAVDGYGGVGEGAAIGAITGGTKGYDEGERSKVRVVKNCLVGRGYRVLN